jgi:chromosome segregation ATPase
VSERREPVKTGEITQIISDGTSIRVDKLARLIARDEANLTDARAEIARLRDQVDTLREDVATARTRIETCVRDRDRLQVAITSAHARISEALWKLGLIAGAAGFGGSFIVG